MRASREATPEGVLSGGGISDGAKRSL